MLLKSGTAKLRLKAYYHMNHDQLPISAVLIAHREQNNIRRCLASLRPWVTEIIVLGQDPEDETLQIARDEFQAQVYVESWKGFRDQKASACAKARQEWIFSIDADEEVDGELRDEIEHFIAHSSDRYAGAYVPRKMFFMNKWIRHGDWYPDKVLRLFKKSSHRWEGGKLHERVVIEGETTTLKNDLLHYSFPDTHFLHDKMQRYAKAFEQDPKGRSAPPKMSEMALRGCWRFFRCYFLKRGFMDGVPGFYLAVVQMYSTLYRYAALRDEMSKSAQR
jgi:glycosyltransferase involved in cell wall biosynthesis